MSKLRIVGVRSSGGMHKNIEASIWFKVWLRVIQRLLSPFPANALMYQHSFSMSEEWASFSQDMQTLLWDSERNCYVWQPPCENPNIGCF